MAADITPSKRFMEQIASPFHIWMMFAFSMMGALMVIAIIMASNGHAWGFSERELASIDKLPLSITYLCVGIVGFCFFFPWFLALLFTRYFLSEIARLERQIAARSSPSTTTEA
jgi:hypothetical protein